MIIGLWTNTMRHRTRSAFGTIRFIFYCLSILLFTRLMESNVWHVHNSKSYLNLIRNLESKLVMPVAFLCWSAILIIVEAFRWLAVLFAFTFWFIYFCYCPFDNLYEADIIRIQKSVQTWVGPNSSMAWIVLLFDSLRERIMVLTYINHTSIFS